MIEDRLAKAQDFLRVPASGQDAKQVSEVVEKWPQVEDNEQGTNAAFKRGKR